MKTVRNVIIGILLIVVFVYHGQTIKAQRVNGLRLKDKRQEGKITQEQYEQLKQQNTYLKVLFNPKEVLNVD